MARYTNSVSLSPPHFKWATTRTRLRASLHCIFSTLMCFLNERRESHHSPRNFVDFSTGRSVSNPHNGGSLNPRLWYSEVYDFALVGYKPEAIPCRPSLYTPTKVAPMSLLKFGVNPVEMFQENRRTPIYWHILSLFGAKRARKFSPQGPFLTQTWKCPQYACEQNFMILY